MAGRTARRGRRVGLGVALLVLCSVVFPGVEVGTGVLMYVTQNAFVALFGFPLLLFLVFCLLVGLVPDMEVPRGWGVVAVVAVPVAAMAIAYLTCSGLNQRALHARGTVERARVTSVYSVDGGTEAPTRRALLADLSGRPVPGGGVDADGLRVGQVVTVTVDPRGKVPVLVGTPSTGARQFRIAAVAAGAEVLSLALAIGRGVARQAPTVFSARSSRPRRPRRRAPRTGAGRRREREG